MKLKLNLGQKLKNIFGGKREKEEIVSEIEELLITADFGIEFTTEITDELLKRIPSSDKYGSIDLLKEIIKDRMSITSLPDIHDRLNAYLIFGVNGTGKTTTVGKLAYKLKNEGNNVLIAAADTYRDAAIEQLLIWSKRAEVPVIRQFQGSDPGAVVYDACDAAVNRNANALVIDTAGRLHDNENLMAELSKLMKIAKPDMKIFVGESITGNDCVEQARQFNEKIGIDAIILAKADVDEKGGAALSVSYVTQKPIIYLGVGQTYDSLETFQKEKTLENLGLS